MEMNLSSPFFPSKVYGYGARMDEHYGFQQRNGWDGSDNGWLNLGFGRHFRWLLQIGMEGFDEWIFLVMMVVVLGDLVWSRITVAMIIVFLVVIVDIDADTLANFNNYDGQEN